MIKSILAVLGGLLFMNLFTACEKDTTEEITLETDSISDVEGRIYRTVKIGDSWWMAEDLKVEKFRNGNSIEENVSLDAWTSGVASFCLFENNALAPGLLYNWEAVNHFDGLAPEGWHVASEADWQELERYLGMSEEDIMKVNWRESGSCGDQLKVKGPQSWLRFEKVWGNNQSGFTALPTACRMENGNWSNPGLGSCGYWWSSTEKDFNTAYFRNLDYKKSGVFRYYVDKKYGMAVRCVKNK